MAMSVQGRGEEAGSGGGGGEGEGGEGACGAGGRAAAPGGGGAPQTGQGAETACCSFYVMHCDVAVCPWSLASLLACRPSSQGRSLLIFDCIKANMLCVHAEPAGFASDDVRRCDEQAEEEERQRVEAERLAQQLRGRFLLRVWLAAARRQREERVLMRLAACSVAGSLPRSPGTTVAAPERTPAVQLKVNALLWHTRLKVLVPVSTSAHRAQGNMWRSCLALGALP